MNGNTFRRLFKYKADGRLGGWRILRETPYAGDCEDFALTVAWYSAGQSKLRLIWGILTFKYVLWYCLADWNNAGHWVLWVRGSGWIDNIHPEWARTTPHKKLLPALWLTILPVLLA